MPRSPRSLTALGLFSLFALAIVAGDAAAQTVWTGPTITFTKPVDGDPVLPENQDRLSDNVWLTRGFPSQGGLYNIKVESDFSRQVSPVFYPSPLGTEWATDLVGDNFDKTIAAENYAELEFTTWAPAYNGPGFSLSGNIVSTPAVLHLIEDDIYLDVQFTDFGSGYFTYERSSPVSIVETTGDYNGDGTVNAADYTIWRNTLGQAANPLGSGADGIADGTIDEQDYAFWKLHFSEIVSGDSGGLAAASVPEPASWLLLLGGSLILARRKESARQ
jgi:Dockerin type I domain